MKHQNHTSLLLPGAALMLTLLIGCDKDARLAEMAREAAERQARQNEEMARVNRTVAEGTKRLVEADAESRRELVKAQRDLQTQQAEVGQQRDKLEAERKAIARQRVTESMLGPVLKSCLVGMLGVATIAFCLLLLLGLRRSDDADQALNELLVEELASSSPKYLSSVATNEPQQHQLPHPQDEDAPSQLEQE